MLKGRSEAQKSWCCHSGVIGIRKAQRSGIALSATGGPIREGLLEVTQELSKKHKIMH